MYRYRYVHDVPVVFSELSLTPNLGDEIRSKTPIDHPYWELMNDASKVVEAEVVPEIIEPTDEVKVTESPVIAVDAIEEK